MSHQVVTRKKLLKMTEVEATADVEVFLAAKVVSVTQDLNVFQ